LPGQFLQLVDPLPFRLEVVELGDGIPLHQTFECAGPFRLHGHRRDQPLNIFLGGINARCPLRDDVLGGVDSRLILGQLIAKELLLEPDILRIALRWATNVGTPAIRAWRRAASTLAARYSLMARSRSA
jgi:hypothetical protein